MIVTLWFLFFDNLLCLWTRELVVKWSASKLVEKHTFVSFVIAFLTSSQYYCCRYF